MKNLLKLLVFPSLLSTEPINNSMTEVENRKHKQDSGTPFAVEDYRLELSEGKIFIGNRQERGRSMLYFKISSLISIG